jgi:hypothetical protein
VPRSNPSHLRARWAALPRAHRIFTKTLIIVATATAGLLAPRPAPPTDTIPSPYPWPAGVTTLRHEARGPDPATFRFEIDIARGAPVTVHQVSAGTTQLKATTTPRLPLTVRAGNPRPITVRISVYDCAALPPAIRLPCLGLLISNKTAQQQQSFLFSGAHPHDPWTTLRALCHPNRPARTRTSPGRRTHDHLTSR